VSLGADVRLSKFQHCGDAHLPPVRSADSTDERKVSVPRALKKKKRARLGRRLDKGNRRTDLQLIRGVENDERISTDLDCIKNRLWCVKTENHFQVTYTIYTSYVHM
jgi:hypothetical protein